MGVGPDTRDTRDSERLIVAVRRAPLSRWLAAVFVAGEGLVMVGLGALLLVRGFGGGIEDPWRAELGATMAFASGVVSCLLARALLFRRPWARSPTVLVQLLCLPVAVGLLQGGIYSYGVPLVVVPVAVLVLLGVSGGYGSPESFR